MRKFLTFILLLTALPIWAWGPKGHRVIAQVAYANMSRRATKQVDKVLGKHGLVYCSTWADEIKSDTIYSHSYDWHFQDLEGGLSDSDVVQFVTDYPTHGGNLFRAVDSLYNVLLRDKKNKDALRFYIHLISDSFCPMHMGHEDDLGGNLVSMTWFNQTTNLHKVWDEGIIENRGYSYREYALYLMDIYSPYFKDTSVSCRATHAVYQRSTNGALPMMVLRTYHLTQTIYDYQTKYNGNAYIYIYKWKDECDYQLFQAGLFLAQQLNDLYK